MASLEELKARLKKMEQGKPQKAKWKPTDEHTVRLLPFNDEELTTVIKWHYNVDGGRAMYCPGTHGDSCPFCDLAKFLKQWKGEDGRDKPEARRKLDWEWFKKVDAAVKHYAPIVVRKKDSTDVEGPFWWEMTPKTFTSLFRIVTNDDWNEDHPDGGGLKVLTSLTHALDVNVTLKKKGEKGNTTNFDLTDVEERKKFSPLFKGDIAQAKALLEKLPDISEIGKPITTEEAERVFKAWKSSMDETPADTKDAGVEHGTNSAETPAVGGRSVDDVVSKLTGMLNKNQD